MEEEVVERVVKEWKEVIRHLPSTQTLDWQIRGEVEEESSVWGASFTIFTFDKEVKGRVRVGMTEKGRKYAVSWFSDGHSFGFYL